MVFPSATGTWRDPDNFRARWREVRGELGVPDATSHSFPKTVDTLNSLISGVSRINRSRGKASAETLSAISRSRNVKHQPRSNI
jgi:hypothetical protein